MAAHLSELIAAAPAGNAGRNVRVAARRWSQRGRRLAVTGLCLAILQGVAGVPWSKLRPADFHPARVYQALRLAAHEVYQRGANLASDVQLLREVSSRAEQAWSVPEGVFLLTTGEPAGEFPWLLFRAVSSASAVESSAPADAPLRPAFREALLRLGVNGARDSLCGVEKLRHLPELQRKRAKLAQALERIPWLGSAWRGDSQRATSQPLPRMPVRVRPAD